MKKILLNIFNPFIIVWLCMVFCMLGMYVGQERTKSYMYSATCVVESVDYTNDTVVFVTPTGNEFVWCDADDIQVGEIYSLAMNSRGTNFVYDDEIVSIHYCSLDVATRNN